MLTLFSASTFEMPAINPVRSLPTAVMTARFFSGFLKDFLEEFNAIAGLDFTLQRALFAPRFGDLEIVRSCINMSKHRVL